MALWRKRERDTFAGHNTREGSRRMSREARGTKNEIARGFSLFTSIVSVFFRQSYKCGWINGVLMMNDNLRFTHGRCCCYKFNNLTMLNIQSSTH